ncbi:MAG: ComEC family DNA internalization-related competence protein, partial [Burkholderiales bacterium]|nr:ComEC family DNA internalization-related competence protein [Burkholderiales bacterium]
MFAMGFVAGTAWLQQAAALPEARTAGLAVAAILAARLARGWARAFLVVAAGLVAGHDHAAWRAQVRMADELPPAWEGRDVALEAVVVDLPRVTDRGTRLLVEPRRVATEGAVLPSRLSLTWYAGRDAAPPPEVRAGERWRFTVRLKRPRGLANPHAFDFEPWALARGIRATGYVRASPAPERVSSREPGWPQDVHRLRGEVRSSMLAALGEARLAGVLVALAVGDQDAIAAPDWETFWRTGIGHLVSISGLHVTMFASLAFVAVAFLWVRVPALALAVPARKAAAVAGVAAAAAYTLLAGFGVPAQRTLAMLAIAAASVVLDRHASPSRVLAAAAVAVLLLDPWAVLAPGFWLSFGAVGAIFLVLGLRVRPPGAIRGAIATQAAVTLALWPALAALFGEVSLVSPLA